MKRCVMVALCLGILASGAFALDRAIGGGILFNAGFSNMEQSGSESYYGYNYTWKQEVEMTRTGFGGFAFFGLGRFVEFNLGFMYKEPQEIKWKYSDSDGYSDSGTEGATWLEGTGALQLGIYGKYPIPISDRFVFFPTGGVDLELSLSSEEGSTGWKWWHDIWIRAGVGLDVFITERLFIRGHAIYGIAIPVGGEEDLGLTIGHGLLIKLGLGWMF